MPKNMNAAEERFRLNGFPTVEEDPQGRTGNVLLSDEIEALCQPKFRMIDPFERAMLRPASYRLRVGEQYWKGNKMGTLGSESGQTEVQISPGEMVVLRTQETINLPRYVIARWNMKTDLVYKGLLWVGGPQVDPGWVGHLQCPIYNLSNQPVTLRLGDPFAIMDFERTTAFDPNRCVEYPRPPRTVVMEEYQYGDIGASATFGAVSAVRQDFEGLRSETSTFRNVTDVTVGRLAGLLDATKTEQARERDELRTMSATSQEEMGLLRQSIFTVMAVFVAAVGALVTAVAVFVGHGGPYVQPNWFVNLASILLFGSLVASVYAAATSGMLAKRLARLQRKVEGQ